MTNLNQHTRKLRNDMKDQMSEERLRHIQLMVTSKKALENAINEIRRLQSENAELSKFKQEIQTPVSTENFQSTSRFVLQNCIDRLIKKNADLTAKLDKAMEAMKKKNELIGRLRSYSGDIYLGDTWAAGKEEIDKILSASEPMKEKEKEYPG